MAELSMELMEDFAGYIVYALDNDIPYQDIVFNLAHDISGIIKEDKYMLPRTTGYKEHLPKYKKE